MRVDTRTALLTAAEAAARTHGFDGFSFADLAAVVKISKPSVHHHFATKADLAVALVVQYIENMQQVLNGIERSGPTAAVRLRRIVWHYREAVQQGQSLCLCVALSTSRDSLSDAVIAELDKYRGMVAEWLTEVFRTAQQDATIRDIRDPVAEAFATLALLEGAQLQARLALSVVAFNRAVSALEARIRG